MNVITVICGLLLPFLGTAMGAGCVFFMKRARNNKIGTALTGFAAGVMTAASVWSLLIPAMERSGDLGPWAFLPAVGGFWMGVGFLLLSDRAMPRLLQKCGRNHGGSPWRKTAKLVFAVTLHNLPEGMAVGVVLAGFLKGEPEITGATVIALATGIALQNFPEGAVISLPMRAEKCGRFKAFGAGVLSGAVEPLGAAVTLLAASLIAPALPVFLSFAAGAMLWVVTAELIPQWGDSPSAPGPVFFGLGFSVMMALDVALG